MKTGLDIVIPLPQRLTRWLRLLQEITGRGRRLFPGKIDPDAPICHDAINMGLVLIGYTG